MRRKKIGRKVALAFLVVFAGIQFIRPQKNKDPEDPSTDITHFVTVPDTVMHLLRVSCYDCHSNKTNYPWYAEVAPASWWLAYHIKEGKAELNFSEFSQYSKRRMKSKLSAIANQVKEREMPLKSYMLIHADAKLHSDQVQIIIDWVESAKKELDQKP